MDLMMVIGQAANNDQWNGDFNWPLAAFLVGALFAFCSVAIVIVWQGLITWRARMSIARESAYRQLAEDAVRAQERTADRLERAVADLGEIRQRTAELERMLKEVG